MALQTYDFFGGYVHLVSSLPSSGRQTLYFFVSWLEGALTRHTSVRILGHAECEGKDQEADGDQYDREDEPRESDTEQRKNSTDDEARCADTLCAITFAIWALYLHFHRG